MANKQVKGYLYALNKETGRHEFLGRVKDVDEIAIVYEIEMPEKQIGRSFTTTLTLKLPKVIDVNAKEVNEE